MNNSTVAIRQKFLDFFSSKGHQIVASSSLVPDNDSSLLFTNAGMNQFKDIFLGLEDRKYSRATTAQRCVRAGGKHNDLDNVGYTERHHTFFEMLGNFSFGDYFKYDAIQYAWELLTDENWFNLSKDLLWVTVYESDHEAYEIWKKEIGVPCERIIRIGDNKGAPYASDNFWQIGNTGLCGPCTEIFYDHGNHIWGGPPGSAEEHGDRYVEIWNIVFIQFNRHVDGAMKTLKKQFVDTGMGLERIAAVLQHVDSNYEIDLFHTLIKSIADIIGINDFNNKSLRVVADHIRSCVFLIADGVFPSNESRGYVLRRIIRRAVHHGNILGMKEAFLYKLVEPLIDIMGITSSKLKCQQSQIEQILKNEEKQFASMLERGLILLNKELEKLKGDELDSKTAFRLYDTYGFPIDLTTDICRKRNIKFDKTGFETAMEEQRCRARKFSNFTIDYNSEIFFDNKTQFLGYNHLELSGKVVALFVNKKTMDHIIMGQNAILILDKTPFYPESGGQVGDKGEIRGNNFNFVVNDTKKYGQIIGHIGKLSSGLLKVGEHVQSYVNKSYRICVCLNHTAVHLIHSALRNILGNHVIQKGSLVNDKMLRFDFSHFEAMKSSEIYEVEDLVNLQIRRNMLVKAVILDLNKIKKRKKIIALFDRIHDERVRMLRIGDFSTELCGGTHVSHTGDIGLLRITSESGVASGVRRIEAITGEKAIKSLHVQNDQLQEAARLLNVNNCNISEKIHAMLKHNRKIEKELQLLKDHVLAQESTNISREAIEIKGVKLLIKKLTWMGSNTLRVMVNNLKNQLGSSVIILATVNNNKIFLVTRVSKDITNCIKARELVNMIAQKIDGKGGGCIDIAQAGGKNIAALPEALSSIKDWISDRIKNYKK